ncbi:serine/threonine-protein kinase [Nocardia sp. NPDC050710]|uniref:serine/threonine-protein kinase n=1 Tax=Nocardia sp. NPDC050710 TaxID=3157220 RepID=UPI0033C9FCE3
MQGQSVALTMTWLIGERIGGGGFGNVYAATCGSRAAVAKFVPKERGADRELLFANPDGVRNIVPILDCGEHGDHWVLVMPRAGRSLRDRLDQSSPLPLAEAVGVLEDICAALTDLDGKVVHRDLKPDNILWLDGSWCLSDFGISRYAEAATAPDTRKYSMSPAYAAPEQWRHQRATSATDMYAFGIIAYEMIVGRRPFPGPTEADYRIQHLHGRIPDISCAPTALATLIGECLYKAPGPRLSPADFGTRLDRHQQKSNAAGGGLAHLEEVNRVEVERRAEADRSRSEALSAQERREEVVHSAQESLDRISGTLRVEIEDAAPAAIVAKSAHGWSIRLGNAELRLTKPRVSAGTDWGGWQPQPVFDVVATATIDLRFPTDENGREGLSHSLWFGDIQQAGRYKWFECAFSTIYLAGKRNSVDPFALEPGADAARALAKGMDIVRHLAWPFTRLEVDDLNDFISRWARLFARAAAGDRYTPSANGSSVVGSWRSD